ncbi:MAG: hypothetical protein ABR555_18825 [Pyrinomonadaceae bacterium]
MTELIVERHEKWEPVEGIVTAAARALVREDHEGLVVTMMFSEISDAPDSDLRIKFGRVAAYTVYEEFVHPWEAVNEAPKLAGDRYIYPLLKVKNSKWMASLPHLSLVDPNCTHYRLLTIDKIVDVLSSKTPELAWIKGLES